MINVTDINKAKSLIKTSKEKPILVKAQNNEFNRKMIEYGKFDILIFPDDEVRKIGKRNIDSGLNEFLAKTASKNNISIGFDLNLIRNLGKKQKSLELIKLKQNILLCRKAKAKIKLLNFKDKKDAFSLLLNLGASTQQASEAIK